MGIIPLLELLRYGFTARLPYDHIFPKLLPFITNKAKLHREDLIGDVLRSIGCDTSSFKLGRTQIFFRPKQEHFVNYLNALKTDAASMLGIKMSKLFFTRQRNAWSIFCRFLGKCWFSNLITF